MDNKRFNYHRSGKPSNLKRQVKCPACQRRRMDAYVDTIKGVELPLVYGVCSRIDSCGYVNSPYADGYASAIIKAETYNEDVDFLIQRKNWESKVIQPQPITYIDQVHLSESVKIYEDSFFFQWLDSLVGYSHASKASKLYRIGSLHSWRGRVIFWQLDSSFNVRAGKVIKYDPITGKRSKKKGGSTWVRKVIELKDHNLVQCLFGEHLLNKFPEKTVAIVESEKTAIVCSIYLPQLLWLATGGLSNLNESKLQSLKGRNVVLYPDLGCLDKWRNKMHMFPSSCNVSVSDFLETNANNNDISNGLDIADYLTRFPLSSFSQDSTNPNPPLKPGSKKINTKVNIERITDYSSEDWTIEINEVENYLKSVHLPHGPIKLNSATTITDLPKFLESSLTTIKKHNGNKYFRSYLDRIQSLKNKINELPKGAKT